MNIHEFVTLLQDEYKKARITPIGFQSPDEVRLSPLLFSDFATILGITYGSSCVYRGSIVEEDASLTQDRILAVYSVKTKDDQLFDFGHFSGLPVGNARIVITSPPAGGISSNVSPTNYFNHSAYSNQFSFPTNMPDAHAMPTAGPKECAHVWKTYNGFSDIFDFCSICDKKRK